MTRLPNPANVSENATTPSWMATAGVPSSAPISIPFDGRPPAAAEGAPVKVIHDGTIAFADSFAGFGKLVIVDHGGQSFSLYGNLLDRTVTKGAHIDRGQIVGHIGPSPAGPAGLYFELRVDGHPVDPLQWLKKK